MREAQLQGFCLELSCCYEYIPTSQAYNTFEPLTACFNSSRKRDGSRISVWKHLTLPGTDRLEGFDDDSVQKDLLESATTTMSHATTLYVPPTIAAPPGSLAAAFEPCQRYYALSIIIPIH
jgi:hypothetical protein